MQRLFKYDEYNKYHDLLETETSDPGLNSRLRSYVGKSLNESLFIKGGSDQILNALSKSLFGNMSKVTMIDQTIEKIYQLKAKLSDQQYVIDKSFDEIADKMKDLRKSGADSEAIRKIRKQRDAKENEFKAFEKRTGLEIERGLKLLEDIIGGNKRRQAYADSVLSQAEVNLADHEYKKARKEGKLSGQELSKLMKKLEDRKRDLKDETEDLEKMAQKEVEAENKSTGKSPLKVQKGGKSA
jgi:hypothetical protein